MNTELSSEEQRDKVQGKIAELSTFHVNLAHTLDECASIQKQARDLKAGGKLNVQLSYTETARVDLSEDQTRRGLVTDLTKMAEQSRLKSFDLAFQYLELCEGILDSLE